MISMTSGSEHPREQAGGGLRLAELRLAHTADRHISHTGERLPPRRRRDHGRTDRATRRPGGRGTPGLGGAVWTTPRLAPAPGSACQGAGEVRGRSVHSIRASGSSGTELNQAAATAAYSLDIARQNRDSAAEVLALYA